MIDSLTSLRIEENNKRLAFGSDKLFLSLQYFKWNIVPKYNCVSHSYDQSCKCYVRPGQSQRSETSWLLSLLEMPSGTLSLSTTYVCLHKNHFPLCIKLFCL